MSRWRRTPPTALRTDDQVREAYAHYGGELLGFAMNALHDRQLAEEVVQETFVRAWRKARDFDPERGTLRSWLFAIARNRMVDVLRSAARQPTPTPETPDREAEGDPFDRLLSSIQLDEALRRLSPEHRQAVTEVYYRGRTCAELAASLRIPAATVRSRLYYGVRALHLILEENGWLA